jgi:ABC-2 type transport system permease protein
MTAFTKYAGIMKIALRERVQYRFDFFMSFLSALMYGILYYMLWKAIYAFTPNPVMGWPELVTYIMVGQTINPGRYSPAERIIIFRMAALIREGDIALELIKPVSFQMRRFIESIGYFAVETLWVNLPLLVMSVIFLGVKPPADAATALYFLLSMMIAFLIMFALNSITMMLAFWTTNMHGMQMAKRALVEICSGILIPFQFFPPWLKGIVTHLPFQGLGYIPISIYTGRIHGADVWYSLAEQSMWALLILFAAHLIWRAASRQITVYGG